VQYQAGPRNLHVERQVIFEPMIPIDVKAQKIDVKLAGLGFIENTENRDGLEHR
jgi:hypothetical protein